MLINYITIYIYIIDPLSHRRFQCSLCDAASTKHLHKIYTLSAQRLRRRANIVQFFYKCFVFAGDEGAAGCCSHRHDPANMRRWPSVGQRLMFAGDDVWDQLKKHGRPVNNRRLPMLDSCWSSVEDCVSARNQHWVNALWIVNPELVSALWVVNVPKAFPANTRHSTNAVSILGQRRRRWANI